MDTKFTKGPWSTVGVGATTYIDDVDGFTVAQVIDCEGVIENAPLIAAAPDMYAELESIVTLFEWGYNGADLVEETAKQVPIIKDLLKKARGES